MFSSSSQSSDKKKEKQTKQPFVLPDSCADEILYTIFKFCDFKTLSLLACVNKRFAGVSSYIFQTEKKKDRDAFFLSFLEKNRTLSFASIQDVSQYLEMMNIYWKVNFSPGMHAGRKQSRLGYLIVMLAEIMEYLTSKKIINFEFQEDTDLKEIDRYGNSIEGEYYLRTSPV